MTTTPAFDLRCYSEQRANLDRRHWYVLDDYIEIGFTPKRAQEWFDAVIIPSHAEQFEQYGLSPQEAWEWSLVPDVVKEFQDRRFTKDETREWTNVAIFADEAMFWRHAGYLPEEASSLRLMSSDSANAVLWSLTGLAPSDALDHAEHGANPADFLRPPDLEGAPDPGPPSSSEQVPTGPVPPKRAHEAT